ncbi:MAG: AAA family ATPase, partial [Actinobacteria bacterium]|nr:AAA family ATPase [Actinomycetota bacterium]
MTRDDEDTDRAGTEVLLSSGERTRVLRRRLPGGTSVIVKQFIGPGAVARRRHEREILLRLAGVPGVAHLSDVADPDGIVLDDDGGRSLAEIVSSAALDLADVPALACELARTIAAMHACGVVHKDVNPANILLAGESPRPVLIDFDVATTVAVDRPAFVSHRQLVGTLPYLPPEQTGRTGLPVDHRADLYSLGATLYELVCGRPPVADGDDLQMIREILLRAPVPLTTLRPDVPPALSDIVARLLAKEPEHRYQSAEGAARDLARVVERPDERFDLARWDFPLRLAAPSRLVGREAEKAALLSAFDEALSGGARGLLVAGAPGVGKSALVNELRRPVATANGWFVTGKAEQYQSDTAVGVVLQAVRGLGRLLLAEPADVLAATRTRLVEALAADTAMAPVLVPELEAMLGPLDKPAGPEGARAGGDPRTAGARLRRVVVEVLRAIVSPSRPVVLVADDLQWADPASLDLFDALLTEPDLPGLLVVGAYRAQEVDPGHPLTAMMAR